MLKVSREAHSIYSTTCHMNMATLSDVRGMDSDKYTIGLGQHAMSIIPPDEDIVTMGANAAHTILKQVDASSLAMVLFATESSIDQSKAAGLYIQELLQLPSAIRVLEFKQACY